MKLRETSCSFFLLMKGDLAEKYKKGRGELGIGVAAPKINPDTNGDWKCQEFK